jgi:hypothetical protein
MRVAPAIASSALSIGSRGRCKRLTAPLAARGSVVFLNLSGAQIDPVFARASVLNRSRRVSLFGLGGGRLLLGGVVAVPVGSACVCGGGAAFALARVRGARDCGAPARTRGSNNRAKNAWVAAGLKPITLHECRHSYAAYMIAAGINTKAISTYMGHASVTMACSPAALTVQAACFGRAWPSFQVWATSVGVR